jgi:carbamoyl-phosphate synthase small subunit
METIIPKDPNGKIIAFMDCGAKNGIFRNFLDRGITIIRCPFNQNPFETKEKLDGIFFSNGPGDPETCTETIEIMKIALKKNIPIFGICLGNQLLALAAGAKTKKMIYGNRGLNQPVQDVKSKHCLVTSQNHGYEVDESTLPAEYEVWFRNLNDQSVEGIRHKTKPICSIQFHPEACAGPEDAQYLFDDFVKEL